MKRIWYLLFPFFIMLFCADRVVPTNPYDPQFTGGDYHLTFGWKLADSATMVPFTNYYFTCKDSGNDRFVSYSFAIVPDNYYSARSSDNIGFDTTVKVVFTAADSFTLSITALRPNGSDTTFSFPVVVVNPYKIWVDTAVLMRGDTVKCRVKNSVLETPNDTLLTVRWQCGSKVEEHPFTTPYIVDSVKAYDTLTITAQLLDTIGSPPLLLNPAVVPVPVGTLPAVSIADTVRHVELGKPFSVDADIANADTVVWIIDDSIVRQTAKDTLLDDSLWKDSLSYTFSDTVPHFIIVTSKTRYDTPGDSDTVVVYAQLYRYTLERVTFPTTKPVTIDARDTVIWEVKATENGSVVPDDSISYKWTTPQVGVITTSRGTCKLYFNDSVPRFSISVFAFTDKGTSLPADVEVIVRAGRPKIELLNSVDTVELNDWAQFVIRASDTLGRVDTVYYQTSFGDTQPRILSGDTLNLKCTRADSNTVRFWCVDNKHFTSNIITASFTVTTKDPHFLMRDTLFHVFTNDSVHLQAAADPGTKESTITEWYWSFNNGAFLDTTTGDQYDTAFSEAGTVSVMVRCRNSQDSLSIDSVYFHINVTKGYPVVAAAACITPKVYINDTVKIAISASDSNKTLTAVTVRFGTDSVVSPVDPPAKYYNDTINLVFDTTGTFYFSVTATDDDSLTSVAVAAADSVIVELGRPVVQFTPPDSCWMMDENPYTVTATDNGTIAEYFIQWDAAGPYEKNSTGVFNHRYVTQGPHVITCYVIDDDSLHSESRSATIYVKPGYPRLPSIDTDSCWIMDSVSYTVTATDENDSIAAYFIQWDAAGAYEQNDNGVFKHLYTTPGQHAVACYVIDNDGLHSDTLHDSIYAKQGLPSITSIGINSPTVYVRDSITFTVTGRDPNDTPWTFKASLDGDNSFEKNLVQSTDTAVFKTLFPANEAGNYIVRFRITDKDSQSVDDSLTFSVLSGAPTVRLTGIDSTLFVNDYRNFTFRATDPNGSIRKIYVRWNGNSGPIDSIEITAKTSDTVHTFPHLYDTSLSGTRQLQMWATDDDSITTSPVRDTTIIVRKGAPALWGDKVDTLWVVVNNGTGINYNLHVRSMDTNGTIIRYYWDERTNFDSTTLPIERITSDSLFSRMIGSLELNNGFPMWIYARDNDGFVRGGQYTIYADGPPIRPVLLEPIDASVVPGDVNFKWKNFDTHDKSETFFRIMYYKGTTSPVSVNNMIFTKGSDLNFNPTDSSFTLTGTGLPTGTLNWFVVAKDMQGSETVSDTLYFDH